MGMQYESEYLVIYWPFPSGYLFPFLLLSFSIWSNPSPQMTFTHRTGIRLSAPSSAWNKTWREATENLRGSAQRHTLLPLFTLLISTAPTMSIFPLQWTQNHVVLKTALLKIRAKWHDCFPLRWVFTSQTPIKSLSTSPTNMQIQKRIQATDTKPYCVMNSNCSDRCG